MPDLKEKPKTVLDYAPPPVWYRRKWVLRVVFLVACLTVPIGGWIWLPQLWHDAQTWYWERQCASYILPGTQVVYEEYAPGAALPAPPGPDFAVHSSTAWATLTHHPKCLGKYAALRSVIRVGYMPGVPTLFLHRLRDPAGKDWIVVIQYGGRTDRYCLAIWNACAETNISRSASGGGTYRFRSGEPLKPIRFYAGQPDPHDPSRFTIDYEMDGSRGTFEGRLVPGGGVDIKVLSGPGL